MLALKIQNLKLSSRIDSVAKPSARPAINPQQAMVVFDLQRNPAVILTANDTFCHLVGCEMVNKSKFSIHIQNRKM
jgi:hypothetical protein